MLLLVLILVVVAFALLVLALVQGSVAWAWLSVAISVAAASALLVDWWQRQQAAKDDEELPPPAPSPQVHRAQPDDHDSVTEFIPVAPRSLEPDEETQFLQRGKPAAGDPTADDASANEQTVLLPRARPSGSTGQPPGAAPGTPPWSDSPSRSVTNSGPPVGSPAASPARSDGTQGPPVSPGEETVFQPVDGAAPPLPRRTNGAALADGRIPPAGDAAPGGLFATAADGATTALPAQSADEVADPTPEDEPERPFAGSNDPARPDQPAAAQTAAAVLPPAGPDGEPPEEQPDPEAFRIVATAQDEVVVVDERPRYHLEDCPFLPGRPVIPLPIDEAVELGFSPCGWCRPNRSVADRHQPASR